MEVDRPVESVRHEPLPVWADQVKNRLQAATVPACEVMPHEPMPTDATTFDCRACGVCCREASDGRILVPAEDITRFRREGRHDIANSLVEGHFGERAFPCRPDGACVIWARPPAPTTARFYPIRGTTCRDFEAGSRRSASFAARGDGPPNQARLNRTAHGPSRGNFGPRMLTRVVAIALNTYRESVRARILLGLARGVAFAVASTRSSSAPTRCRTRRAS